MKAKRDSAFFGAKKAAASDANLPLMQQQGPAGGQLGTFEGYADRPGANRAPSSTYGDISGGVGYARDAPPVPPLPKLHPGMVSTPAGSVDGRDEDISYHGARN